MHDASQASKGHSHIGWIHTKEDVGVSKGDRKLYLAVDHVDGSNHLMHSVMNLRSVFGEVLERSGVEERGE